MKNKKIIMKKAVKVYAAVFLVGIVLTSTASAITYGTADIENHNNALSDIGRLWGGGLNGAFCYTGIYSWTNEGGTGEVGPVPDWGFCIELTQAPVNGLVDIIPLDEAPLPVNVTYGTPMGPTKADYIRELWSRDFDPNWVNDPTTANKQLAEAFSAAIWEIIYEALPASPSDWDVNSGPGFHATYIEQAATANTWLHSLTGKGPLEDDLYAITPIGPNGDFQDGQDYLVQIPNGNTPEPATIALLGLGALSLLRRGNGVYRFVPMD
jgi:hypothetical protein